MEGIDKLFSGMRAASSGMSAERVRIDTVAKNIANANTTRTPEGGPYKRLRVVFSPRQPEPLFLLPLDPAQRAQAQLGEGVRVGKVLPDPTAPKMVFDPGHPDADAKGYVAMPNISIVNEMVDLISASRAYEANVTAINAAKSMAIKALEIGKA